jgi:hypothetical protein
MKNSVFVSLTDEMYFPRLKQTIKDLRETTRGAWNGDIVVICVHFLLPEDFKTKFNIQEVSFAEIEKIEMLSKIKDRFEDGDGREFNKLNQWEKLHVFDEYFLAWDKVVFLDAGLRILDSVQYLLDLECDGLFLAPNDAGFANKPDKIFTSQISHRNASLIEKLTQEFGADILGSQYFLNCIWVYDTKILNVVKKTELIEYMNKYPLCITNEMAIMNMIIHFKYGLWREFPHFIPGPQSPPKFLFDWCEYNNPGTNWTNYCYLKYPVTIGFDT